MAIIQKSLRIPERILKEIEQIAAETKKDFSSVANELLEEAVKLNRCPGIILTEGVKGRRARVAGTGIEVWEIIATYKAIGKKMARLHRAYHWLTVQQLRSAMGYYKTYPEEIDGLIAGNEGWTAERLHKKRPFLLTGKR